jgi:acyl dehydratase
MKYSEINIGDQATVVHKITEEDIVKFVNLTGDDNKLHVIQMLNFQLVNEITKEAVNTK